ncbi:DUF2007 domain-containing protein [Teredinibacter haidensis]|uniref:putative signal transducing protein n=1 Tax=Teredinibacter haidensis TaxID=2731755 RepID=UPI000948B3E5|nr:DUF2007 domain-containing protein [Teredinibacter haidensis]
MKLVYEASNSIEAHMILNLLEQAGLSGRIDGELLQGGVGELQAIGLVRVMIVDEDYTAACTIIENWDNTQVMGDEESPPTKKSYSFFTWLIGFILGLATFSIYNNSSVRTNGIDYDGDGSIDEKWTYVNDVISKVELDRNLDGKVDGIVKYNKAGIIDRSIFDHNFDGYFESEERFKYGNVSQANADSTGDGFKDHQMKFKSGVLTKIEFLSPVTKRVVKAQHFDHIKMTRSEIDNNGDGVLETIHLYDEREEIKETLTR